MTPSVCDEADKAAQRQRRLLICRAGRHLRFDSRGYPESDGSGNGKYIFVPDGNGDLIKMYIDADIYVVPKDFSLAEKVIDEA